MTCLADTQAAAARLAQLYEQLTPDHLDHLADYYAADARFKDPFNDVRGVPAIRAIFAHMFASLDQPRFVVTQQLAQGTQAFLAWEFHFRLRRWQAGVDQCIHGATLVHFDATGRVTLHRDYWDTSEELYQKLPVLGPLMRWLRRAGSATHDACHADPSPP
ncbi:nuclear transport factor 2 family protein [Diaphorobacter sp.]|uniref:nuclear transport factor 2 family protein n=1 Tax=Diaphorobacter sp. TaxID=1934310 RepID=UPI003D0D9772